MAGCHDDVGHQGRMRTLSLLRERFFWPGMQTEAMQHVLKCTRCLRRKTPSHVAPLQPIHVTQPLELVHMDYLSLEPSKGNIENVLVITDHFTRYALAYPSKTQQLKLQQEFYGTILFVTMAFLRSLFLIKVGILNQI